MAYIIMARDECNDEFRPRPYIDYRTEDEAYNQLNAARERYPEARSFWVELLKDKDYYLQKHLDCDEDWEWEYL